MTTTKLPLGVYVLGFTIFALGTSEFMLAGLLPPMAADLGVTIPEAGTLISSFAVGMLVGAPVMALLTLNLPRRTTLLGAAAVFAAMHLLGAVTDDFGILLATRVISAIACATYWAVAAVTAMAISPRAATARAMAVVVGGLTVANVVGVPLGTWVGERGGWQLSFLAVGVASLVALLTTALFVPETHPRTSARQDFRAVLSAELASFRRAPLWVALATTATFQAAVFGTFSYLSPMLTDIAGLDASAVPAALLLFGIGTLVGVTIGGRYADRNLLGNVVISLGALAVALLLLALVLPVGGWVVLAAVTLFGAAAFSIASALNARVLKHAEGAPTLAAAVNVSAFNVGNAVGPWLGGTVIAAGLGYLAPIWVSLTMVALALALAGVSWRLERAPSVQPIPAPACETA
ncbi:Cmx/CmrA family chloramphenicol efflux MFS transporter [Pseudactinotalea sp.]|uniref:Cmx/CmrA family chloramphenicol efflux MFS transporter n=1 Tax=Pseudactinotalea sp. TaxID=1926260 RepID=UPI003B3A430A